MSDHDGLTAPAMPCSVERAGSFKCLEKYQLKKQEPDCQDAFDKYKKCKKKYLKKRNVDNNKRAMGELEEE